MPTGYIYEIKSMDTSITETYIGSTWDMNQRLKLHVSDCYNENSKKYNKPLYKYIRENGDFHTFTMRVIESGECEDVTELLCGEQFHIDMAGGIENLLNLHDALQNKEQRKKKQYIDNTNRGKKNVENKRFPCKTCGFYFDSDRKLQLHLETQSHKKKEAATN